ncbi:MAG: PAS domain-containing protein [Candidatus Gracilibacteria bacterium]
MTESIDIKSPQESEQKYRKVVNNIEDPVFVLNLDGTLKFASWDVENTLEYKPEELDHQIFFLMIHPEDLSTFLGAFGKVIRTKNRGGSGLLPARQERRIPSPYRINAANHESWRSRRGRCFKQGHQQKFRTNISTKEQKKSTAPTSKKIIDQKSRITERDSWQTGPVNPSRVEIMTVSSGAPRRPLRLPPSTTCPRALISGVVVRSGR